MWQAVCVLANDIVSGSGAASSVALQVAALSVDARHRLGDANRRGGCDLEAPLGSGSIDLDAGFALNGVVVYPRQFLVVREGERQKLEPKVMAILLELARQPGEVVGRNHFAETVWRDRVVSDEVLSRNVSLLRSALGDDARNPRFIQTIPTAGYRLVADVSGLDAAADGRRVRPALWVAALVTIIVALWAWLTPGGERETLPETTVAVLPFANLSDTRDAEYFSDGVAEEVLGALSQADGLSVVARTSSFVFRERDADVREIGHTLGAGSVLEGSVRKSGQLLRVSARLVSANDGLQLWSESFDVELKDVFVVQDEISRAIVQRLVGTLAPDTRLDEDDPVDLEAYQLFLRANHQLHRRGTGAVTRSVDLYQQAIAADADFARAYVGLAQAWTLVPSYVDEAEPPYMEKAAAALDRAEMLGDRSARLLGTRAYVHFRNWQWWQADDAFRRALSLAPNDSDIRQQYSQFLGTVGYLEDALVQAQRAVDSDPLSGVAHQRLAVVHLWLDDLANARKHFQMAEEMGLGHLATPEAPIALLTRAGRYDEVAGGLRRIQRLRGLSDQWVEPVMVAVSRRGGVAQALTALESAYSERAIGARLYLGALYFIGDEHGFYDGLDRLIDEHAAIDLEILFTSIGRDLQRSGRFDQAMERLGIREFWQRQGRVPDAEEGAGRVD